MKHDPFIRDAIDESLSSIHFDAKDMHSVLRAARSRSQKPAPRRAACRVFRPDFAFAAAMMLILAVPLGLFALRVQDRRVLPVAGTAPQATLDPHADRILATPVPPFSADESEAIRTAKACFEAQCDTSIFSFEEYAVSVTLDSSEYTVVMESIYGNGCRFSVAVSAIDGSVLRHSTPRLATIPAYLDHDTPQIQAWYAKYGPFLFTWPQDAQAEFSRRYEGAVLRTAYAQELSADEAAQIARSAAAKAFSLEETALPFAYPMLYAGQEEGDTDAVYVVYCFTQPLADTLPETHFIVSLRAADGAVLDVRAN